METFLLWFWFSALTSIEGFLFFGQTHIRTPGKMIINKTVSLAVIKFATRLTTNQGKEQGIF
jgi:hypothetical protein